MQLIAAAYAPARYSSTSLAMPTGRDTVKMLLPNQRVAMNILSNTNQSAAISTVTDFICNPAQAVNWNSLGRWYMRWRNTVR